MIGLRIVIKAVCEEKLVLKDIAGAMTARL